MRSLAFFLALVLLVPTIVAFGAPRALPRETATEEHVGVLSGSGLGLHVAKVVPWRAAFPVNVPPGAARLTVRLSGTDPYVAADPTDDLGLGVGWFASIAAPTGEIVASSPVTISTTSVAVGTATIRHEGFGTWQAIVDCSFCVATAFTLSTQVDFVDVGANLTLDEQHLVVVPGKATTTGIDLLNTGASAAILHLSAPDAPPSWAVSLPAPIGVASGAHAYASLGVTPPASAQPGANATFGVLVKDQAGRVLDRVTLTAAYSPALAEARAHGHAVIAIVEFANANPYHIDFRGPSSLHDHPEFVMANYPADARSLPLTLDAPTYAEAVNTDQAVWANAKANTLYYVPGTRFIGFMSFGSPPVPDEGGHTTGTTSLAAGALGEAPDAYIVSLGGDWITGIRWAARQPWIDSISMSLGIWVGTCNVGGVCEPAQAGSGNVYVPFSIPYAQKLAYESGKRVFTGSSQGWEAGVGTSDGTVPYAGASGPCPYTWTGDFTGTPWTFSVETYWPWTELPWKTSCNPDVVAQGWDLVAASAGSLNGHNDFGHTSGATPQAAGAYTNVVQRGRETLGWHGVGTMPLALAGGIASPATLGDGVLGLASPDATLPAAGPLADGVLTVREAERVYLHGLEQVDTVTSFERHGSDPRWENDATIVPPGGEYASEGYGLLTGTARHTMVAVMLGEEPEPLRTEDDAAYASGWAVRQAFWAPQMADEVWVF